MLTPSSVVYSPLYHIISNLLISVFLKNTRFTSGYTAHEAAVVYAVNGNMLKKSPPGVIVPYAKRYSADDSRKDVKSISTTFFSHTGTNFIELLRLRAASPAHAAASTHAGKLLPSIEPLSTPQISII